jgi:hypothetical protein
VGGGATGAEATGAAAGTNVADGEVDGLGAGTNEEVGTATTRPLIRALSIGQKIAVTKTQINGIHWLLTRPKSAGSDMLPTNMRSGVAIAIVNASEKTAENARLSKTVR